MITSGNADPHNTTYYQNIDLLPGCPLILEPKEVAFICNISLQTVQRMIEDGTLSTNCDGEILKADLITYITTHTLADRPLL